MIMSQITKQKGRKIARKLQAKLDKKNINRPHDLYIVYDDANNRVASFTIRKGSLKDEGNEHIPRDLHLHHSEALLINNCKWWREEYFAVLRQRGMLGVTGGAQN